MECIRRGYQRQNTVFYARYGKEYANEEISRAVDISYESMQQGKRKDCTNCTPSWGFCTNVSKANIWEQANTIFRHG